MTWYAYFDYTIPPPAQVLGWYDTDAVSYTTLPDFRGLLELTADQWNGRFPNPASWAVSGGTLVPYVPPIPLPQLAQLTLNDYLAQGIAITSLSLPAVNATYALDSTSTGQVFQIGTFANSFGIFPNGTTSLAYPDINSGMHVFTVPVFVSFLLAVASLVSMLQTQTGIMSQGGTPSWPAMSKTIT